MKKIFLLFILNAFFFNFSANAHQPDNFSKNFYMLNGEMWPDDLTKLTDQINEYLSFHLDCVIKDKSKYVMIDSDHINILSDLAYNLTVGLSFKITVNTSCPRHEIVDLNLKTDREFGLGDNLNLKTTKNNVDVELVTKNKHSKHAAKFRFSVDINKKYLYE